MWGSTANATCTYLTAGTVPWLPLRYSYCAISVALRRRSLLSTRSPPAAGVALSRTSSDASSADASFAFTHTYHAIPYYHHIRPGPPLGIPSLQIALTGYEGRLCVPKLGDHLFHGS